MNRIGHNQKGFTLIELLVVIAIIGLLASIVLVATNSVRGKARDARRVSDLKQIRLAIELYYDTYGYYPGRGGAWVSIKGEFVGDGAGNFENAISEFIPSVPQDPLHDGNTYFYSYDPSHGCLPFPDGSGGTLCFHTSETGQYTCATHNPITCGDAVCGDMWQHLADYCFAWDGE